MSVLLVCDESELLGSVIDWVFKQTGQSETLIVACASSQPVDSVFAGRSSNGHAEQRMEQADALNRRLCILTDELSTSRIITRTVGFRTGLVELSTELVHEMQPRRIFVFIEKQEHWVVALAAGRLVDHITRSVTPTPTIITREMALKLDELDAFQVGMF